jgi:hypothetical protein
MMSGWLRSWVHRSVTGHEVPPPEAAPPPQDDWARTGRAVRNIAIAFTAAILLGGAGWYALSRHHYNWAVIVVAGDWHAEDGGPSKAFDNSRRDVSAELRQIGFDDAYMMQFSVRPDLDNDTHPMPSTTQGIGDELALLTSETPSGCILYFSTHGAPQGMLLGNTIFSPAALAGIVGGTCGTRPTVIIISACYSGVFVPALEGDNRMVMTAARPDRTSFGCTQDARYPYFDTCVVQNLPGAHDFPTLADRVKACVQKREQETGMSPPSEPQVSIGRDVADKLPTW